MMRLLLTVALFAIVACGEKLPQESASGEKYYVESIKYERTVNGSILYGNTIQHTQLHYKYTSDNSLFEIESVSDINGEDKTTLEYSGDGGYKIYSGDAQNEYLKYDYHFNGRGFLSELYFRDRVYAPSVGDEVYLDSSIEFEFSYDGDYLKEVETESYSYTIEWANGNIEKITATPKANNSYSSDRWGSNEPVVYTFEYFDFATPDINMNMAINEIFSIVTLSPKELTETSIFGIAPKNLVSKIYKDGNLLTTSFVYDFDSSSRINSIEINRNNNIFPREKYYYIYRNER